jgi:TolA-binding protein
MADTAEKEKHFLEKDKRVNEEINRLTQILIDLDADEKKLQAAESLIENAAFMSVTLQDLRDKINREGCVSKYQNGENQWGTKQSPEVKTYNQMLKNHMSITKQLTDLLPSGNQEKAEDGFTKFVNNRPE